MVTIKKMIGSELARCRGKSTDEKPTDVGNGSTFYEMDTHRIFMFDGETKEWIEQ